MRDSIIWPDRFREMVAFVDLSDEDQRLVRASAPIIMEHVRGLTDVVYDHFLKYPAARKYFVTEDEQIDDERIELNKRTMIQWLRDTAAAPMNEGFPRYIAAIGIMHRDLPSHRPHLDPVPSRYIIGTISYYQTAIAALLTKRIPDTELASRTSVAWNKLLMLELDMLLSSYLSDQL